MSDAHDRTITIYDADAARWELVRAPDPDDLEAFRDLVEAGIDHPGGAVVDLGCGPGWHLEQLPPGTIALDASASMLKRVPANAPSAARVLADLRALPFVRGSLRGAWASRSYVHLARASVPMALWDLHRSLRPAALAHLVVFEGDLEHGEVQGDDFPGRSFSAWPEDLFTSVLEGAGFEIELIERRTESELGRLRVWCRRARTLADTVGPDMRLLLVGLNPSLVAADAGVGFHRRGNRAWPALRASGLATRDRDPAHLLRSNRIGMTDLVKRASARADGLTSAEYRHGIERLDRLCAWLQPGAVCIAGLAGWRAAVDRHATAGPQHRELGGRPVYLMPNPSGVNAHVTLDGVIEHLSTAAELADAN